MHPLYTIGYEGQNIETFAAYLHERGVKLLLDIRDYPVSRKPGFSKTALATHLAKAGVGYMHLKGLGNPARKQPRVPGAAPFDTYIQHLDSPCAKADMQTALAYAQEQPVCLLCFEHDPQDCHRHVVAERMAHITGQRIEHLTVPVDTKTLSFDF